MTEMEYWETLAEEKMDTVESCLGNRYYVLSKMFQIHCTDAEVARLESLNERLLGLSNQMYKRTASLLCFPEKVDTCP